MDENPQSTGRQHGFGAAAGDSRRRATEQFVSPPASAAPAGPPPGVHPPPAPGWPGVPAPGWPGPQPSVGLPPWQQAPPGYGPPVGPRINLDVTRIAAIVVAVAGLLVLVGSLFSLYTITVAPSAAQVPGDDALPGEIRVGIGFFDVVPVLTPPVVAQAIPVLLVLAALCALPVVAGRAPTTAPLAAVFAGTGALLALVLTISSPLPSVELTGQLLTEFQNETGAQDVDSLVASMASVGPGAGLIVVLACALLGWGASLVLVFKRAPARGAALPAPPPMPPAAPIPPRW